MVNAADSLCVSDEQQAEKKSEPQFRTCLTQTGAKLGSDFYFELAAATQEKKERKNPKEALGERVSR